MGEVHNNVTLTQPARQRLCSLGRDLSLIQCGPARREGQNCGNLECVVPRESLLPRLAAAEQSLLPRLDQRNRREVIEIFVRLEKLDRYSATSGRHLEVVMVELSATMGA